MQRVERAAFTGSSSPVLTGTNAPAGASSAAATGGANSVNGVMPTTSGPLYIPSRLLELDPRYILGKFTMAQCSTALLR